MQSITFYNEQDVLCGRGGGTLRHAGNKKYRELIKSNKPTYLISSKNKKTAISRSIVAAIRQANGRFLERSKDLRFYYDIGDAKATEKTSQALREGQPKLRKRMIDNGVIANDFPCSTEHMISLLPTASLTQRHPDPVFVGNDSYSSVDKNDIQPNKTNHERSTLEKSLNHVFIDTKPVMNDRYSIGNCRFHPMSDCQPRQPKTRMVTPPTTPPNPPQQQPIENIQFEFDAFPFPFPSMGMGPGAFDDSNSIMTFEMDDDEMMDNDDGIHPIFPISTPSPPLTNHFRALNELRDNVPIYDEGDQPMLSNSMHSTYTSPLMNHLRALTELKGQVPIYPSLGSSNDLRFNNSRQLNGNTPRNNSNASFPSNDLRFNNSSQLSGNTSRNHSNSSFSSNDIRFNNSSQNNRNTSRVDVNASFSSIGYAPNQGISLRVNF
jgi:hypothetical protein